MSCRLVSVITCCQLASPSLQRALLRQISGTSLGLGSFGAGRMGSQAFYNLNPSVPACKNIKATISKRYWYNNSQVFNEQWVKGEPSLHSPHCHTKGAHCLKKWASSCSKPPILRFNGTTRPCSQAFVMIRRLSRVKSDRFGSSLSRVDARESSPKVVWSRPKPEFHELWTFLDFPNP